MAEISVTIDASKLQKFLADTPDKLTSALSRVIQKFAFQVERESKIVTPVDTGRLRGSIASEIRPLQATIAPNVTYAVFVHEGTRFMRARPFMRWGLNSADRALDGIINSEIKEALE